MNKINKNIVALGTNSFFTDFSSEMILPLLPLFLERFLHASKGEIGLIEGMAEFGVALLIALSGFYSDRLGKRKILTLIGYGFSNLVKPLAFFAQSATMVATIRIADRVGKGIRSAPRDALISHSTAKKSSGFVFGFHKMMDSAGAVVGSLSAFGLLWFLGESEATFRTIFALSLIPGLLAMAVLIFFVVDAPFTPAPMQRFRPKALSAPFYWLVAFQSLFSLFAMNYSFMILKVEDNGMALAMIPLAYTLYNLILAIFAIPIGKMADRFGKATLLSVIYMAFALGTLFMACGTLWGAWIGFGIYGFFAGGFNSLAKAIISDTAPTELKATAYGVYYTSIGVTTLLSLAIGGWLWDNYTSTPLFLIASFAAMALSGLLYRMRKHFLIKI
ncbi:MAG: MFS transporter [Campylobacterales bacterium]|nr:MFS transporter [Campylobacterales bacterium]